MSIAAMKLGLEYLRLSKLYAPPMVFSNITIDEAITALHTAIAEAEKQEPVGHFYFDEGQWKQAHDPISFSGCTKLYTPPPPPAPKQEQEQCWCDATGIGEPGVSCGDCPKDYAAPVQAQSSEPLTDEQIYTAIQEVDQKWHCDEVTDEWAHRFARLIEAKIKGQA